MSKAFLDITAEELAAFKGKATATVNEVVLFGNGMDEKKVVFDGLLAKWGELFTRTEVFDQITAVRKGELKRFTADSFSIIATMPEGEPVKAPVAGTLLKQSLTDGAVVAKDEVVAVLESMKMELEIKAPSSGVITYSVPPSSQVAAGCAIATISGSIQNVTSESREQHPLGTALMFAAQHLSDLFLLSYQSGAKMLKMRFACCSNDKYALKVALEVDGASDFNALVLAEKPNLTLGALLGALGKPQLADDLDRFLGNLHAAELRIAAAQKAQQAAAKREQEEAERARKQAEDEKTQAALSAALGDL